MPSLDMYGTSLTDFAEVFSVPTKKFIGHELTVWLPWWIKHYIFRQDIPKPPPIIATADEARAIIEK